jgi:putative peptide zinc metalloprotease protein
MYELVLADGSRFPLLGRATIGRARESDIWLDDPSVSRLRLDGAVLAIEEAGSSHGTWVDGRRVSGHEPLADGTRIRVGDQELVVERLRSQAEAGRTSASCRSGHPPRRRR